MSSRHPHEQHASIIAIAATVRDNDPIAPAILRLW